MNTLTENVTQVNLVVPASADGVHPYDDLVDQWVVIMDGKEVAWASTQSQAWQSYNEMLRVDADHKRRDPLWSVESPAGFTASVDRNGQVSYTDHMKPEPAQLAIRWSELRKLAWRNGRATHHVNQATFYRQVPGGVEVCEWTGEVFTNWQRHWASLPETAEPL